MVVAIAAARPASAAPTASSGFLAASFQKNVIPADGTSGAVLHVELVRLTGGDLGAGQGMTVTLAIDDASTSVCSVAGGTASQGVLTGGVADFFLMSTTQPGVCHVSVSADAVQEGEALLTTRLAGTATRLTVSGNASPRVVDQPVALAVDIDDVFINLVGGDETTVVTAAVDPGTCSGAPGGEVTVAAATGGLVTAGRAWFTARSLGAYRACQVRFTAPGLLSAVTTVAFSAGPPDHVSCAFSSGAARVGDVVAAAVEVRDAWGNRVVTATPYVIAFARTTGDHTTLVSESERTMRMGATFFFTRADSEGADEYRASIVTGSMDLLPVPAATCGVSVGS